jgi:hypothetical protein
MEGGESDRFEDEEIRVGELEEDMLGEKDDRRENRERKQNK